MCHRSIYSTFPQRHIQSKNLKKNTFFWHQEQVGPPLWPNFSEVMHSSDQHTDPFSVKPIFGFLHTPTYIWIFASTYICNCSHWSWSPIICYYSRFVENITFTSTLVMFWWNTKRFSNVNTNYLKFLARSVASCFLLALWYEFDFSVLATPGGICLYFWF